MIFAKRFSMVPATLLASSLTLCGPAWADNDDQPAPPPPFPAAPVADTPPPADPPPPWRGPLPDLETANPQITNPNLIFPGQMINYPDNGGSYTVRPGDTLALIAGQAPPMPAPQMPPAPPEPTQQEPVENPAVPAAAPPAVSPRRTYSANWDAVAACESGGNWGIHTGNGFEGGVQFLNSTWLSVKAPSDPPHAYQASKDQQIAAAERLAARSGMGQWPVCGHRA